MWHIAGKNEAGSDHAVVKLKVPGFPELSPGINKVMYNTLLIEHDNSMLKGMG
jgi:hypothetical protein